ncbi:alpha/beta fold hydrolase [Oceanospirillum linum]|uniref:alpha/beta fold hydrolase n=1 Tax=Oceanospirillum linum TaxID=966 RepID=UPI00089F0DD2|nr:alpha/beta hydrolase [Oceanospirillum linum]SEG25570.1 Pimeloyl-ACP methyl ester carboxylesterase [Oleiphilus messinensis]SMP27916.1 Pimeloyl-ACP methyl ester carboxylesterase [Oceanospirillum linum]
MTSATQNTPQPSLPDQTTHSESFYLATPFGQLFAKRWTSAGSQQTSALSPPQAAPFLLFHDSLGSVELWRDFPQRLAEASGRDVITYDRLGFGLSDPVTEPIDINFIALEAERFIPLICDYFQLERFIAFGHSVGGCMAVYTAAQHPHRCEALITESAQAFVEELTRDGIRDAEALFQDQKQLDRLARYHGERTRWVLDSWINSWLSPTFDHWALDSALANVTCPTLVLHGELDEYGSAAQPAHIANGVQAEVQLELLPGIHHVPHRENPDLILDKVVSFLKQSLN